jgi:uncharacterized oligopeptide transporter (OPT) family protein
VIGSAGAGAVATGGIISMARAMPVIIGALIAGFRDLGGMVGSGRAADDSAVPRTDRDLSMGFVVLGSLVLVLLLAISPKLGLGLSWHGLLGAALVVVFGFLFVTVSSRLTGEVGSSSNPISGMTIATLLMVCLVFFVLDSTRGTNQWGTSENARRAKSTRSPSRAGSGRQAATTSRGET